MNYRPAPARQGLYWLRQGAVGFFSQSMALGGLFLMGFLGMMLISIVPVAGLPLSLMITPCVSFGLMAAVGELRAGRRPMPTLLIEGLRGAPIRRRNMLRLGLLYGALMLAWAVLWLSGLDWDAILGPDGKPSMQALQANPQVVRGVMMVALGNVPLMMVFMHAAALVYWNQSPVLQALRASIMAMLHSLLAYALFLGGVFVAFLAISSLVQMVLLLVGAQVLVLAFTFAVWAVMCCVTLGGLFQAFIDCHPPPAANQ